MPTRSRAFSPVACARGRGVASPEPADPTVDEGPRGPWHWLFVAWLLVAGGFLLVAPRSPLVWNESFFSFCPPLREILWADAARWLVSLVGGLLIAVGSWEVAQATLGRRS
jgi:hypothetical protein